MARPSEIVREHCGDPQNAGRLSEPDGVGEADLNGRAPRIRIEICVADGVIHDFGFTTQGCGYVIAAGSVLSTLALGATLGEASKRTPEELETAMGGVAPHKRHCVHLAIGALQAAIANFEEGGPGQP